MNYRPLTRNIRTTDSAMSRAQTRNETSMSRAQTRNSESVLSRINMMKMATSAWSVTKKMSTLSSTDGSR